VRKLSEQLSEQSEQENIHSERLLFTGCSESSKTLVALLETGGTIGGTDETETSEPALDEQISTLLAL
jgi:L-asparaginase/Glu-tRNA(Gln) amidotransferase subunit D